jgi:hypothetical protein
MRELSILCNTEAVKAILEGQKTQTRRIIKPQPKLIKHVDEGCHIEWKHYQVDSVLDLTELAQYQIGDKLYVRESFSPAISNL